MASDESLQKQLTTTNNQDARHDFEVQLSYASKENWLTDNITM